MRVTASLGEISSLARGVPASDMLLSLLLGGGLTVLFSVPLAVCIKKEKVPSVSGGFGWLYVLYFVLLQAFGQAAFLRFSVSEVHPEAQSAVVLLMASAACGYAAFLGVEAVGRSAAVCFALLLPVAAVAVLGNIRNAEVINFFPLLKNSRADVLMNALLFAANSGEIVLVAGLAGHVNGNALRAYYASVGTSYLLIVLTVGTCIAVTGYAAQAYRYPIYTLFKMASLGSLTRLDAVHTAFWILASFLKGSAAVYAAAVCFRKVTHGKKCVAAALLSGLAALLLSKLQPDSAVHFGIGFNLAAVALLQLAVPLLYLLLTRKRRRGRETD